MEEKMLSITDEDSILISAQLVTRRENFNNGTTKKQTLDIELIVKKISPVIS